MAARRMPKAENENGIWFAEKFVDDPIGTVNDLADSGVSNLWNHPSHFRELADGERLVDELIAKAFGRRTVVSRDEDDDLSQVVLTLVGEDYWPAHASTSFRASSAGIPSRR